MILLPRLALSVRQPWAWAILHAGKDVENRSPGALRKMNVAGVTEIAIHASKGMTRGEYAYAAEFMASIGVDCPLPHTLARGGIIGSVAVAGIVKQSPSRWFFGPRAILLKNPKPCPLIIPAVGALGLFEWRAADFSILPAPARWMIPRRLSPLLPFGRGAGGEGDGEGNGAAS